MLFCIQKPHVLVYNIILLYRYLYVIHVHVLVYNSILLYRDLYVIHCTALFTGKD